ncbi:acyl-CoA synthetase [Nocardioides fonticola]|uniref:Acyl-CoA synthetase n=1 Tax=Nocardioides fonticola TaxID=450363 RepID=A0ABP7XSA4_9ACTN
MSGPVLPRVVALGPRRVGEAVERGLDIARALRVLQREGLLEPLRLDRTLRNSRETVHLGPLTTAVRVARRRTPDAVALADDRGEVTYRELDDRAASVAHGLLALLGRIEREPEATPVVGILCRDHRGPVIALAAAGYAGARAVLLNTGSAAPQLATVLAREGVEVLVHDADFADVVAQACSESGQQLPTVVADAAPAGDVLTLDGLADAGPTSPPPLPATSGGLVILTSGTTGVPKGAPRSRMNPLQSAQVLDRLPFPHGCTVLMAAPIFHGTGLSQLCLALAAGCRIVLARRFDAATAVATIRAEQVRVLVLVPTMLHRILALDPDPADLASLERIYAAGSALPAALCVRTRELLGDVLYNMYGSTEVGVAAVATPQELALAPGCVGRAPAAARVLLLGPDRRPVPDGEPGIVFVRSALAFTAYTDGSGKEVVDGYVSTGDVGRIDEYGLLHIEGREDDMIVSGGENVVPAQVEALLAEHSGVDEVAVVGVPDEEFGQRLRAVVVLLPGAVVEAEELRALARERLARHEVPREVWFVAALPRNPTGKVLKRVLAAADSVEGIGGF